ncbi:unnamed protein product [Ambrosiozyma monospora]|uniref:Unnamed protein product n=1 Tax=Ambrosiozyma monospora TaxID=43982 RepID=A0ACB5TDR0_AMBMO|nr:unnamed protein product [Ambrosiozyma monospora]
MPILSSTNATTKSTAPPATKIPTLSTKFIISTFQKLEIPIPSKFQQILNPTISTSNTKQLETELQEYYKEEYTTLITTTSLSSPYALRFRLLFSQSTKLPTLPTFHLDGIKSNDMRHNLKLIRNKLQDLRELCEPNLSDQQHQQQAQLDQLDAQLGITPTHQHAVNKFVKNLFLAPYGHIYKFRISQLILFLWCFGDCFILGSSSSFGLYLNCRVGGGVVALGNGCKRRHSIVYCDDDVGKDDGEGAKGKDGNRGKEGWFLLYLRNDQFHDHDLLEFFDVAGRSVPSDDDGDDDAVGAGGDDEDDEEDVEIIELESDDDEEDPQEVNDSDIINRIDSDGDVIMELIGDNYETVDTSIDSNFPQHQLQSNYFTFPSKSESSKYTSDHIDIHSWLLQAGYDVQPAYYFSSSTTSPSGDKYNTAALYQALDIPLPKPKIRGLSEEERNMLCYANQKVERGFRDGGDVGQDGVDEDLRVFCGFVDDCYSMRN